MFTGGRAEASHGAVCAPVRLRRKAQQVVDWAGAHAIPDHGRVTL